MKFISVVVPAYNEHHRIGKCLESLIEQDYPGNAYEIIAVDNNSSDSTMEVIKQFPVRAVSERKKGRAVARNAGIRAASGDILAFIDADCIPARDWLQNMMSCFSDISIGCIAGEISPYKPASQLHNYLARIGYFSQSTTLAHPFLPFAQTGNAAYTREVLDAIGLFDENLLSGQDADLSWRMQLETDKKIAFAEKAVVYHPYPATYRSFYKQKMRHAYGSVALYMKYRHLMPAKSRKETYWEYRALAKNLWKTIVKSISNRPGQSEQDIREEYFGHFAHIATKSGLILGSIENRVWYL